MKFASFGVKLIICFFLLIIPIGIWLFSISKAYSVLYAIPSTGEEKILIDSLQVFPNKTDKTKLNGYQEGWTFEIIAPAVPNGPDLYFYIKTSHKTSQINEPYFHTTTQKLFRTYGRDISKASRWERTTKCAQFTFLGTLLFWSIFLLITTLCLSSYFPLLGFVLAFF